MLDKYQNEQPIVYKILKNAIQNDHYSHAYLIETGSFSNYFDFTMSFVKSLLCPLKNLTKQNCADCHQCEVIDSGNFPEIEIIAPDGLWIKKEQLTSLQKNLTTKALIGTKRIYIIKGAEKLNKASANSILKFLEEPEGNIIAILLTDNVYSVLPTIRSRCQILRLHETKISNKKASQEEKLNQLIKIHTPELLEKLDQETINNKTKKVIEFVNYYEKHHLDTLLYINKLWTDNITGKEEIQIAFEIMINYYKDILNKKLNKSLELFDQTKEIETIAQNNQISEICQKITILVEQKENIKYNANTNLLMDKLIITLEGGI